MAEEPQTASTTPPTDGAEPVPQKPSTGEDRKTAAAMSQLETATSSSAAEDGGVEEGKAKGVDAARLGEAASQVGGGAAGAGLQVKVAAKDVAFMVEELEVSKAKATELLKANGGDRMAAVKAYVLPAAKA